MLIVYERKGSGKERWLVPEGRSSERKECLLVHEGRSSARKDDLNNSGQKLSKESSPDLISGNKKNRWLVSDGRSSARKDDLYLRAEVQKGKTIDLNLREARWLVLEEAQRGKMTCTWGSSERQDDLDLRKIREARWLVPEALRGKMICTWSSERQNDWPVGRRSRTRRTNAMFVQPPGDWQILSHSSGSEQPTSFLKWNCYIWHIFIRIKKCF